MVVSVGSTVNSLMSNPCSGGYDVAAATNGSGLDLIAWFDKRGVQGLTDVLFVSLSAFLDDL